MRNYTKHLDTKNNHLYVNNILNILKFLFIILYVFKVLTQLYENIFNQDDIKLFQCAFNNDLLSVVSKYLLILLMKVIIKY